MLREKKEIKYLRMFSHKSVKIISLTCVCVCVFYYFISKYFATVVIIQSYLDMLFK